MNWHNKFRPVYAPEDGNGNEGNGAQPEVKQWQDAITKLQADLKAITDKLDLPDLKASEISQLRKDLQETQADLKTAKTELAELKASKPQIPDQRQNKEESEDQTSRKTEVPKRRNKSQFF